jgi:hypothetical protein
MPDDEIYLIPAASGWVQARFEDSHSRRRVFVRFEPDAHGRWNAAEWSLPGYPPEVLRRVPFHRITMAVNANERVLDELAARLDEAPEPGFRAAFGEAQHSGEPLQLVRPAGRTLDDSFYGQVGFVYRQAVGRGMKPRLAIAKAAGVSPDVAGRWIYEARKRGLIPKTRPGKVTA